ncbi:MAG: DNA mismatch repair endonuclease MutL [Clostridia bacterium]|nr:DNA mismatch repair endonuclease MutL [Clostridia bacterium]
MGIINVLDFSVANLIAAGEVVDRPASVIKELLENSIDAGADDITVEIKRGGITFMRVTDNGKGISKEDLPIAVKRHATSKIHNAGDLDSILTLGFRGEALAAIASVSKLRIMSKTADSEVGHILESEGGSVKGIIEAGCANGTTVIVENLFENVPARLKFLKKDVTEAMAVSAYVEKIALSRPDISIKLIIDGNMKFMTSGDSKLYNVIYVLFGRDFAKRLIPVDNRSDGVHVFGYVGAPDNIRANRNFQNFFINHRFIKSKTVSAALEQAYSAFIPSDKFPCAILNIDINPALVDVNVHPAKLEVKFSNEKLVFEAVYSTVRQALESKIQRPEFNINPKGDRISAADYMKRLNSFIPVSDGKREKTEQLEFAARTPIPEYRRPESTPVVSPMQNESAVPSGYRSPEPNFERAEYSAPVTPHKCDAAVHDEPKADVSSLTENEPPAPFEAPFVPSSQPVTRHEPEPKSAVSAPKSEIADGEPEYIVPEYRIIGEAFYSYVFVETGDSVLIIDKHAAHERIIFEQLKNNLKKKKVISQMLLVPIDVVMTDAEAVAISEYADELKQTGFEFEIYGNTVSITETPIELDSDGVVPMIQTIAGRLADGTGNVTVSRDIIYEKALFQASCKAAVKIGHIHDAEHLKWICERVLALDIIKFCPHGRPVAFELTKHDFERQFKRV